VKDGRLYAIVMASPDDAIVRIKTLAKGSDLFASEVSKVELLGVPGGLKFTRGTNSLEVALPGRLPHELPLALRITPSNLSMLKTS
jgi:alpha-L-fucosidase